MSFTSRIALLLSLFTIIWRNVSGEYVCGISILDAFGRNVYSIDFDGIPSDDFNGNSSEPVMEGYIALTDPPDACLPVQEPFFLTNFTYFKFALIDGSKTCKNKEKIHNAGQAGFDFAVIFDPDLRLYSQVDAGSKPHIPAVLISFEDGLKIKHNYLYNNSSIYNYRVRFERYMTTSVLCAYLLAAFIGLCLLRILFWPLLVMAVQKLFQIIQERRNRLSSHQSRVSSRNGLSSDQINKLIPIAKFSKGDQYDVCAICLQFYRKRDKLRRLPCSHAYHDKCIDEWLINNHRNCPLCKRKIKFGDSADESDSEDSELTSPAENTPLLTTPSNQGQSWGTFVKHPTTNQNDATAAGPSSLPDSFSNPNNNNSRRPYTSNPVIADNGLVTDSESEILLPPPRLSINRERPEQPTNQVEVHVNPELS